MFPPTLASAQTLPSPIQGRYVVIPIPYDNTDGCTDRSETVGLGLNDCGEVTGFIEFDHSPCFGTLPETEALAVADVVATLVEQTGGAL